MASSGTDPVAVAERLCWERSRIDYTTKRRMSVIRWQGEGLLGFRQEFGQPDPPRRKQAGRAGNRPSTGLASCQVV